MKEQSRFCFEFSICGIDDLHNYCTIGITHILSLLDPGFPDSAIFRSFGQYERLELRFHDIIDEREGMVAPQEADVSRVLRFGRTLTSDQTYRARLLVHCHAGLSRSTAAMVLLLAQARPDLAAHTVVEQVVNRRPKAWPNLRMIEIGDVLLGRRGSLVSAVDRQYEQIVTTDPEFCRMLIAAGRW